MLILLVAFAIVAAVDWLAVHRGARHVEYAAKPAALALLLAAAVVMDPADGAARTALVVALAFSLLGDVALMLPGRDAGREGGPNLFVAGLAAFLAGHLAYVAAFWLDGVEAGWLLVGAVVAAGVAGVVGRPVVAAIRRSPEPALAAPVAAYVAVICTMLLSAIGTGSALAIVGALLFATSDSLIARERFITATPHGRLAIITTYHAAQALLVLSFAA